MLTRGSKTDQWQSFCQSSDEEQKTPLLLLPHPVAVLKISRRCRPTRGISRKAGRNPAPFLQAIPVRDDGYGSYLKRESSKIVSFASWFPSLNKNLSRTKRGGGAKRMREKKEEKQRESHPLTQTPRAAANISYPEQPPQHPRDFPEDAF